MKKEISPAVAIIIIVVVVAILGFAGYKIFLEPKKPKWTPPANYGAPVPYGAPAAPR
jgi:tryptophan-rich sensory protein